MANVVLKPATKEDFRLLYPEKLGHNFYGITAFIDDRAVGMSGVYFNRNWIAFARISEELRPYKLSIWKASCSILDIMNRINKPVFAVADPSIPNSDKLLLKMGFEYIGKDWYLWTP